ncbi:MAG: AraC family transcriptional regulator [Burkholderiaceae bacterium]
MENKNRGPDAAPMEDARARLLARMRAVAAHIDAHPADPLSLQQLSGIAACSPCHFHRQFAALAGLALARYVLLSRMRRAAAQLLHRRELGVLEIALASGYDSPEAFSRAFRRVLGCAPSAFRAAQQLAAWPDLEHASTQLTEPQKMTDDFARLNEQVRLVQVPDTPIALLVHRGPPRQIGASLNRFIAWRREHRLPPQRSATFNILYDDPDQVEAEDYRFGLGAGIGAGIGAGTGPGPGTAPAATEVAPNRQGLVAATIPGGLCAVLRHEGPDASLFATIGALYRDWLPASGHELRDFPIYLQRLRFFPDVPAQQALSEIHLPLRPAAASVKAR